MLRMGDRIWGRAQWLFPRLKASSWSFLGSVSGEDRCTAGVQLSRQMLKVDREWWAYIEPPRTHPLYSDYVARMRVAAESVSVGRPGFGSDVQLDLLCSGSEIVSFASDVARGAESVLVDISAMPKRFFFPILKVLLRDSSISDLVVVYSNPASYASAALAEDLQSFSSFTMFGGNLAEGAGSKLVVAVGFESAGVSQIVEDVDPRDVTYLFPYPSVPPFAWRTWGFLQQAMVASGGKSEAVRAVSSIDPSSSYSMLIQLNDSPGNTLILAPFGPKPVALGMALFACRVGNNSTRVVYTQPRHYNPHYSSGVLTDNVGPVIHAYPVKLGGEHLYH